MSILKKTIAGALTIALSIGAIGTSAIPVLAASENNMDVLQKNVEKAQEEYDKAETDYDNGAIEFLESKMCDYHKNDFTYEKYEENIRNATGTNADGIRAAMKERKKEFSTSDGKIDEQKKKNFFRSWISFDNLKLQAEWLDDLNQRRVTDTNFTKQGSKKALLLNPELVMDSMMSSMVTYYDRFKNNHILYESDVTRTMYKCSENLALNSDSPLEGWYDDELVLYNEGVRNKEEIGHYLNCMKAASIVGFGMYGYDDEFHINHVSTAMRISGTTDYTQKFEETGYTSEEWLKMVNEAEAPLKKNLDEAKANLDAAKKALEEAKKKEDIAVNKVVLSASKYTYNGKTHTPSVKVYDQKGKMLSANQYTVKYSSGRKNLGSYTVDIYGKGDVTGTASAKYVITPAKMKTPSVKAGKKKITVKWKKLGGGSQTYQIYVLKKGTKKAKYYTSTGSSKTIKKLSKKKYYYTKIRSYKKINGKTYYGSWSGTKKVKVK